MTRAFLLALLATALVAAPVKSKATRAKSSRNVTSSQKTRLRSRVAGRKVHTLPAPSYQLHPDPERYQQIQQSLADRGYFKGEVNGQWNDDSVDALKRFQADQKLDTDGKINALTLTGLGLGPKHDGSTASTVPLSAAVSSSPPSALADPPVSPSPSTAPPQFGSPN
ncbi:MAG: peptidoglycan-binding protein [Acidobacteriota bacterium]|nr:peptidoglycan-binding protein [Acidobacteriota bacterium]